MHVPDGKGRSPVIVLNHGYIDPDLYRPGQGMPREQDYLARQGYVVLHTDYRGHASGEAYNNDKSDYALRLPYPVDTINAVYAVKPLRVGFSGRRSRRLARALHGRQRHADRAGRQAGPGRRRRRLRLDQFAGRRQLAAVLPDAGGSGDAQPADRANVRLTQREPTPFLARGLVAALFRSDHRTAAVPARQPGRHLPDLGGRGDHP